MDDNPAKIATVVKIARKTLKIVKQNIVFALAVKAWFLYWEQPEWQICGKRYLQTWEFR